jgi:drug/metabolite transporter (DMT)-like permease
MVAAAPLVIVLLWSTGFVGAKYGLPYAEPFTFLALRLAIAALALGLLAVVLRARIPTRRQVAVASVTGLLLHAGYLGGVFWSIAQGMPASVAAAVTSLQPVLVAALAGRMLGEPVTVRKLLGLAVGVVGVALVLAPGLSTAADDADNVPATGLLGLVVALAAGTSGTVFQKRFGDDVPLLPGTSVQYAASTVVLVVLATTTETMTVRWTGEFVAAMAWLVLVLSIGAVLLLLVLLRRGSASGVSSLFYLVPPATAVEAYLLFGEDLPPVALVGIALTAVGVALVLRQSPPNGPRRPDPRT